ncbi:hypothetical protein GDO86_015968 [Hymenochirus boettgeri]|uniref:Calmin n=1 Tax=Hymenochirus boettgeri TaxID=247094 RepID=A0A8T2JXL7_9PIPI|nr:hypothetical protein GDO86_015968 [Hymenochirus boettgeri]
MAGHEWDWFQREELIGQISDIRVQNLQVERENVQKRTFTRWINLHLEKCNPPLEVKDLFIDIQDGKVLMALLEILTGQNLLQEHKPSSHRIFRLNNIAKALIFLENNNVKLVNIDAAEIADGNPSLVLGLIWNIILFLQIKELTCNLNRISSSSSLSSLPSGTDSDTSHPSTPNAEKSMSVSIKDQRRAIRALLKWVQQRTRKYGVAVQDFACSWKSGLAFLALIKAIDSSLVDIKQALNKSARENLADAFQIAQEQLRIPRILEPEDLMVNSPDEQSVMTYITLFLEHFPELDTEDFIDQMDAIPVESTFVHYKDGPTEEESKIITLNKDEYVHCKGHPAHKRSDCSEELITEYFNPHENMDYWSQPRQPTEQDQHLQGIVREEIYNLSEQKDTPNTKYVTSREGHLKDFDSADVKTRDGNLESITHPPPIFNVVHGKNLGTVSDKHRPLSLSSVQETPTSLHNFNNFTHCESDICCTNINKEPNSCSKKTSDKYFQTVTYKKPEDNATVATTNGKLISIEKSDVEYACIYVPHSPENLTNTNRVKEMTVFQPYRAGPVPEDMPVNKQHLQNSVSNKDELSLPQNQSEETDSTDSTDSDKISVIPHNLFYYPHFSVPIADVLHAFAEDPSDNSENSKEGLQLPSDSQENVYFEEYLQTMSRTKGMPNEISPKKDEEEAHKMGYDQISSGTPSEPDSRTANHSTNQKLTPQKHERHSANEINNIQTVYDNEWTSVEKGMEITREMAPGNAKPETDLNVLEDRSFSSRLDLVEEHDILLFSRETCRETSPKLRRNKHIPDGMDLEVFVNPEIDGDKEHTQLSCKRNVCSDRDLLKGFKADTANSSMSYSFQNMYLILIVFWFLLYCLFILQDLDVSKVHFFATSP